MATKSLRTTEKMKLIYELKRMGIPQSEVAQAFKTRGVKPPSQPTIRKYYNMEESVSTEHMTTVYAKEKAFNEPHCRKLIIRTLTVNGPKIPISSVYDLLQEQLVDTGTLATLPGNEQTLRNYCRYLKESGQISVPEGRNRVYDEVRTPEPGKQMQLDYGVVHIGPNEQFHFIALLLRHSRMLFVKGQDHRFNAAETCRAIYAFFILIGGRVQELVIDQDACLIYEEQYGEITTTRVFKDFLTEQGLGLFVCRKADPETKGAVENTVKYVKNNYLPSRRDWPLQKLIDKLPDWCKRKNRRIHATEFWKIDDHFTEYEQKQLLPLQPSQYDQLGCARMQVSVSKTRQARYRTNRYTLPRDYHHQYVWIQVTPTKLMFYPTSEAVTPICTYDLPSEQVKHQLFEHEAYKKRPSTAYRAIYDRILNTWYAPELRHYLNGLRKEHEHSRFLQDQFIGFERMLHDRDPSPEELAAVMERACEGFRYKLSQLREVWDRYLAETAHQQPLQASQPVHRGYELHVEKRATNEYAQICSRLSEGNR